MDLLNKGIEFIKHSDAKKCDKCKCDKNKCGCCDNHDVVTRLQHMCSLDIRHPPSIIRKTSVICTIGPACKDLEMLKKMIKSGMNVARMNFSHGTHEYHAGTIKLVREAIASFDPPAPVAIALDTKGPEIRTGMASGGEIVLVAGDPIKISTDKAHFENGTKDQIYMDYVNLPKVISPDHKIFIDDGLLSLKVVKVHPDKGTVECVVENGGKLGSQKGVNLPGVPVDLPAVSERDKLDLLFGVQNKVDMIFASFIRDAQGVNDIRAVMGDSGRDIKIIPKIENHQGIFNIDEIIAASDGIMVARGDMGIEIPPEKVFLAQKMIIGKCNIAGKPSICATQMLESMVNNPRPTRAEVSDVANAVLDGADCTMLSGESAKGKYPLQTLQMMCQINKEAEAAVFHKQKFQDLVSQCKVPTETTECVAIGAVEASFKANAKAIIVLTTSGKSAQLISKYRPKCPIYAVTRVWSVAANLNLYCGVIPVFCPTKKEGDWMKDVDCRVKMAIDKAKCQEDEEHRHILKAGDTVIVVTGWQAGSGFTNTMRLVKVP
ncbi:unnamed protein product [Gordionus sp. m RMFG-2023]|uniref:pyruvate kinase PKM-like n=1 Tax=Gordionus sp. m RMFG-2023 TaxID=3053472 RepID=UPI0030E4BD50